MSSESSSELTVDSVDGLPLEGIRVLDLTSQVGVYCGKLLADLGADVIKVERPAGDALRRKPPFSPAAQPPESSLLFAYYNNNKRGVTLDFTNPDARPLLKDLASSAHVVLASPDQRHPIIGLGDEASRPGWLADETIFCSITPFGLTGPWRHWRATPFTSFACSGQMHAAGEPDGPPLVMPGQQLYDQASTRAATAIEAVLFSIDSNTERLIDIAAHEVGTWQKQVIERYSMVGRITSRATAFSPPPSGVWKFKDGYADIAAHAPRHWDIFVEMLGSPEELVEPLYRERGMRVQLFDLLIGFIEPLLLEHNAEEFVDRGQALGLPCALMYRPDEFVEDVQPISRGTLVHVDHPLLGNLRIPGPPAHGSPTLATYRRAAPTLGESNVEVYVDELGYTASDYEDWRARGLC